MFFSTNNDDLLSADSRPFQSRRSMLLLGLLPLALVGCEAPLNLDGVHQEQSRALHRTDQLQALTQTDRTQVAVGNTGLVLTRQQGQGDWQRQVLPGHPDLIAVSTCPDNSLIALSFEKQVWRSDDQGQSWTALETGTHENLLDLTCAPDGSYWAVGSFSTFVTSADGGKHWHETSLNEDAMLTGIQFVTPTTAYATGEFGTVARSDDAGRHWTLLNPMRDEFYPQASLFTDVDHGWSVGLDGTVLHTSDGARSWQQVKTPTRAPLYGLLQGANHLYVLGDNATLLERTGNGWKSLPTTPHPVYLRAALHTAQGLVVAGGNGTLLTLTP